MGKPRILFHQRIKGKKIIFSVVKRKLPTGKTAVLDLIEHPGAGLIVPFLAKDKVIFLRQYRAVFGAYLYELPAGTLDKSESALVCVKRELVEETAEHDALRVEEAHRRCQAGCQRVGERIECAEHTVVAIASSVGQAR